MGQVRDDWLTAEGFRRCFAAGGDGYRERDDGSADGLKPAAVLVPLVLRPEGLTMLLTQRTDHLHDHAGQVAFPGGRAEAGESPTETALREAHEEIGLAASQVEILGFLPDYHTITGYRVSPVVGLVSLPLDLQLDAFEVAQAFETPLAFLLDPDNHQRHQVDYRGRQRQYWAMPWQGHYIWGATAGMIVTLYRHLASSQA